MDQFVAEAGVGGDTLVVNVTAGGVLGDYCSGETSRVTKLDILGAEPKAVATFGPFPSYVAASVEGTCPGNGFSSVGAHHAVVCNGGDLTVAIGLGCELPFKEAIGAGFGTIQQIGTNENSTLFDASAYEFENNPDGEAPDSNPYGLACVDDGFLIVDAGGNTLLEIAEDGTVSNTTVFPRLPLEEYKIPSCGVNPPGLEEGTMIPPQSVPTSVVVGPDGAYYVGILAGFPFVVGTAKVYRLDQITGEVTVFVDDLSNVVGIAFGPDGSLYVAQLTDESLLELEFCGVVNPPPLGSVIRIKNGNRKTIGQFERPGGIVVSPSTGDVYITTNSTDPEEGKVVKLTQKSPTSAASRTSPFPFY